jgi:phosphate transport system substrate-binding protein
VRLLVGLAVTGALVLTGCGTSGGKVRVDGSSTVYLLTAVAAEDFQLAQPGIPVTVGSSGTGGGFARFCRGETDANDASRPIKETEAEDCARNGIEYGQLSVAVDALTVVVNKDNDWATCLTMEQLAAMWAPDSTVNNWNQIDPAFPDVPLRLFGPGTDSGTFDYFTDAINGEEGASRTDYSPSEDDNVTIQGVSGEKGGIGYFGLSYYEQNKDKLKLVAVDSGAGCVAPSTETVQDGTYTPLSRPLYMYFSTKAAERPEVKAFAQFIADNEASLNTEALFVPLSGDQSATLKSEAARITG